MPEHRRQVLRKTAATGLASVLVAGCTSTGTDESDTTQTDESQTDSANTTSTQSGFEDYGPWVVGVVNDLEEESTVTVRLLTPDGDRYKKAEVHVAGGDGENVFTVTESGAYTLEASTSFDSSTAEFNACKLNTDAAVELQTHDGERQLIIHQRHADPAARTTIDEPYTCE